MAALVKARAVRMAQITEQNAATVHGQKADTEKNLGEEMGTGWFFNRDKASLDIFWLKDKSLEQPDNLSDPDVLAQEIVEDLEAALEQFREIAAEKDQ